MRAFLITQAVYQTIVGLILLWCLLLQDDKTKAEKLGSAISIIIAAAFGVWAVVLLCGGAR